ncbi:hypothetical protein LfeInf_118 [Lactobacillus phage LfeInf]|uniref:Uncharacterized protein n=1 Tax=Lactobacillus phage LfeInf TaxID=1567484 RepID=A0A0A7NP65_9CAUD|nr:hypothetical protein AXJ15_gp044 [Lactobacillus phage LfeInf]AIZ94744.1 hypothetical protein LfeInf_118 [Lactobacillus phage LfeInf]
MIVGGNFFRQNQKKVLTLIIDVLLYSCNKEQGKKKELIFLKTKFKKSVDNL